MKDAAEYEYLVKYAVYCCSHQSMDHRYECICMLRITSLHI